MKANYYVYLHESPSEKVYVGITRTSLRKRWQKGKGYLTGSQPLFEKAIRKYGWDNFRHKIVLEGVSIREAKYTEKYLIRWYKLHNKSYNITDGGDNTSPNINHKGKNNPMYGRHETNPMYGIKGSDNPNSIRIYQYSLEGIFMKSWGSIIEAARHYAGVQGSERSNANGIITSLKGKKTSALGFIWRYEYVDSIDMSNYSIIVKKTGVIQLRKRSNTTNK